MIENELFIIPVSDGIDSQTVSYFSYSDSDGFKLLSYDNLIDFEGPIVAWNLSESLSKKRNGRIPKSNFIVDLEALAKYYFGLPSKEFSKEFPWSLYQLLKDVYPTEQDLVSIYKFVNGLKPKIKVAENDINLLIQKIANKYSFIKKELRQREDWDRFEKIEVPIFNIFLETTIRGIGINKERINELLEKCDTEHFKMLSILRTKYEYKSINIDYESIRSFLVDDSETEISNETDIFAFLRAREHLSEKYKIALNLIKNKRTKKVLLSLYLDLEKNAFPIFDISGTITSRILVNSPNLQNIRKSHRDIITSEDGKDLLYLDYSCFEPSILAALSKDKQLIEFCRTEDMYTAISLKAGFTAAQRKQFKILFLAFSFGMEREGLINFISELLEVSKSEGSNIYQKIFDQFETLKNWKTEIWEETIRRNYSTSLYGNRRYRKNVFNYLDPNEKRWAINQVIQGTASLILKHAIIEIKKTYNQSIDILLPMHDAILMQSKKNFLESEKEKIKQIMQKSFSHFLPEINVKVSDEPFFKSS